MEVKYYRTSETDCASNDSKSISWVPSARLWAWISPKYVISYLIISYIYLTDKKVKYVNRASTGTLTRSERSQVNYIHKVCGLQTAQISSPVDYEIWAVMRHRVCQRQIHGVDKLRRRLIDVWCGLEQSNIDEAIDQWRGRLRACVCAKGGHFEYSLWTDNVDFVHIC